MAASAGRDDDDQRRDDAVLPAPQAELAAEKTGKNNAPRQGGARATWWIDLHVNAKERSATRNAQSTRRGLSAAMTNRQPFQQPPLSSWARIDKSANECKLDKSPASTRLDEARALAAFADAFAAMD